MVNEMQTLLDNYHSWLKQNTKWREVDGFFEITTPYLDRHNDYLQIYVIQENGGYVLNDDGYTINDLETSGCKLDSPKRQELLHTVLNGYGIKLINGSLQVRATKESFALRKHNLLQAMLAVNDMFYTANPYVSHLFSEDVANWLDLHDVRYIPRMKLTGKSGFDHMFDFAIPKSKNQPERLVKAINNPNRDTALSAIHCWQDTSANRAPDSHFYAILNDSDHAPGSPVVEAFLNYDAVVVRWSERESVLDKLAS